MDKKNQKSAATEVIDKITSKKETRSEKLLSLIPEGHSPKLYLDLVKSHVLGVDRNNNQRPDEDLMLFLYTAKRTGLDPLANQIYAVYYWDSRLGKEKMTIQAGIDGMRLVAQRSGEYAGQDDAIFTPEDESSKYPVKASVTVYKMIKGARVPFTATARWAEYARFEKGQPVGLWNKMPYLMLSKCAEALALRKAFPNELSGIYSDVEMQQSTNILGDLPTPDRFKKGEVKVEYGAPSEARPEIIQEPKLAEDAGKGKKKAQENASPDDIGTPEAAVPGSPNLGDAPDLAKKRRLKKMGNTLTTLVEDLERYRKDNYIFIGQLQGKLINEIQAEAKRGEFHDFLNNKYAAPKIELRNKLLKANIRELADKVVAGAYDDESPDDKIEAKETNIA